jgi:hypothetical protein
VSTGSDKNIGRLDVTMDDAAQVCGVQRIRDLRAQVEQLIQLQRLALDAVLEGLALQ